MRIIGFNNEELKYAKQTEGLVKASKKGPGTCKTFSAEFCREVAPLVTTLTAKLITRSEHHGDNRKNNRTRRFKK